MSDVAGMSAADPAETRAGDPALQDRLVALEERVHQLETRLGGGGADIADTAARGGDPVGREESARPADPPSHEDVFWALEGLKERVPAPGGVLLTGAVEVGAGRLEYQWARPTEHLLETDWTGRADALAALGHPLRMAILRHLLDGERTVAQLVEELELGSTGVAYHHLSALQSGSWVHSPRRGSWALPADRVIPLLTILIALERG